MGTGISVYCIGLFLVVHIDLVNRFVAESLKETLLGRLLVNLVIGRGIAVQVSALSCWAILSCHYSIW